jgi:hypothetical protein
MAHKKRGQLTTSPEWARHLRPVLKRWFWKGERRAEKEWERSVEADGARGMRYDPVQPVTLVEAQALLSNGDFERLATAVIAVGLEGNDANSATHFLLRAAACSDPVVRGNALLALGHLARRLGGLDEERVRPPMLQGVRDPDAYVRGQAQAAMDDLEQFLGWHFDTA